MTMLAQLAGVALIVLTFLSVASGQALPTASRPIPPFPGVLAFVPEFRGTLAYSLSGSEHLDFGYNGSSALASFTGVSGDLIFRSPSINRPSTVVYSGGYLHNTTGQPSTIFQSLSLTQEFDTRSWELTASDSVRYLPDSPITGLSGFPGYLGLPPDSPEGNPQGILSRFSNRVDNTAEGKATRKLTGSSSLYASGSLAIERFIGANSDNGFDNDHDIAVGGASHRVNALNAISANYVFSQLSYLKVPVTVRVQGVNFEYQRHISRTLVLDAAVGPERISARQIKGNDWDFASNVSLAYSGKKSNASLVYVRSINNGFGVTPGVKSNSLAMTAQRRMTAAWSTSAALSYYKNSSLTGLSAFPFNTQAVVARLQTNRAIRNNLSAYVSYTAQYQSSQGHGNTPNVFTGLSQILGFGLTYAPRAKHFGPH